MDHNRLYIFNASEEVEACRIIVRNAMIRPAFPPVMIACKRLFCDDVFQQKRCFLEILFDFAASDIANDYVAVLLLRMHVCGPILL